MKNNPCLNLKIRYSNTMNKKEIDQVKKSLAKIGPELHRSVDVRKAIWDALDEPKPALESWKRMFTGWDGFWQEALSYWRKKNKKA